MVVQIAVLSVLDTKEHRLLRSPIQRTAAR